MVDIQNQIFNALKEKIEQNFENAQIQKDFQQLLFMRLTTPNLNTL